MLSIGLFLFHMSTGHLVPKNDQKRLFAEKCSNGGIKFPSLNQQSNMYETGSMSDVPLKTDILREKPKKYEKSRSNERNQTSYIQ
jgi:hypothetical protein